MMRTTDFLKWVAHVLLALWICLALQYFSPLSLAFWFMVFLGVAGWLVLRMLAIIGQLVFEMRHDFARTLSGLERAGQYANALRQEIRDLLDEKNKK